jgi:hypothetical protein
VIVKAMAVKVDMADMAANNPQPQALQLFKLLQGLLALREPEAQQQTTMPSTLNIMAVKIRMRHTVGIKITSLTTNTTNNKPRSSSKRLQALRQARSRHLLHHLVDLLLPPTAVTTR